MKPADALVLAFILAVTGAASCYSCDPPVSAQPIPARIAAGGAVVRDWGEPAEVLTRALESEVDGHPPSLRPILSAMQTRADRVGSTADRVMLAYASIYRVEPRPLSAAERVELDAAVGPVKDYSPRMKAIYNRARQIEIQAMPGVMSPERKAHWDATMPVALAWLAGDHRSGCNGPVSHFGDAYADRARAMRMRWTEVLCPGALGMYWRERGRR